ncbi:MAG: metallophosphoesterase family protein [Deltaproteobacteria bacterium]|nr:metallophosphoesterase family protein [Deltaproteobacteria bacterium]
MRYAILSDLHSNLEAFLAVLEKIERLKIDKTVCLGDIVGYNANPNEVVDIVRERSITSVMGNHDAVASGGKDASNFNDHAREAILWTEKILTKKNKEFLSKLPASLLFDEKFLMVHGSITKTDTYIRTTFDAGDNFSLLRKLYPLATPLLSFFGHTHQNIIYKETFDEDGTSRVLEVDDNSVKVEDRANYLINPGSVGQPRTTDKRACFAVFDTSSHKVEFIQVEYDTEKSAEKIIKAGLPLIFAKRLGWKG